MINKRFIKYIINGLVNTLIALSIYYGLLKIGVNYLMSSTFCFLSGVILGYLLNSTFVFKEPIRFIVFKRYFLVYVSSLFLNLLILYLLVKIINDAFRAQIITTAGITVLNYLLIKKIVFRERNA